MEYIGILDHSTHNVFKIYVESLKSSFLLSSLTLILTLLHGDTVKGVIKDDKFIIKEIILQTQAKIVGILHLEDIKLHGHTKKGLPIYGFTPLSTKYPKFYVASSSKSKLKKNVIAVVQVISWTEKRPTASIIKIIGLHEDIDCFDQALLLKNELNIISLKCSSAIVNVKDDMTPRPIYNNITVIDPIGSTDCDDGFHVTEDKLYVHIADVDHYFPEDGPCESELFHKVTSIYALNKVYHMLPENYASDIISLNKKGKKYTLTVIFTHTGEFISVEKSFITVKRNLTYDEAQTMIETDKEINLLSKITNCTDTHKMIETIMIWTNYAIAKLLFQNEIYFSVYCPPVLDLGLDTLNLNTFLNTLKFKSKASYSVLKTENGHFLMGLDYYTHFTSPIRRYADLLVQRLVKKYLIGVKPSCSNVSFINEYTSRVKKYYRDKDILELYLKVKSSLNSTLETTAVIVDYNEETFKVKVYLLEFKVFYSYELFHSKLSFITDVKVLNLKDLNLKLLTLNSKEIPFFEPIQVQLTALASEIRLQRKIKMTLKFKD